MSLPSCNAKFDICYQDTQLRNSILRNLLAGTTDHSSRTKTIHINEFASLSLNFLRAFIVLLISETERRSLHGISILCIRMQIFSGLVRFKPPLPCRQLKLLKCSRSTCGHLAHCGWTMTGTSHRTGHSHAIVSHVD